MEQKNIRDKGFTLIELSIVVVIIGLIVAGVVAGQSLVKQAELRGVVADYQKYTQARFTFKIQYNALPGDFSEASTYWSGASDGDGNNVQGLNNERFYTWQHLSEAGLWEGSFTGPGDIVIGGNLPEIGVNNMLSPFWAGSLAHFGVTYLNAVSITGYINTASTHSGASYPPRESQSIDAKIDDGVANNGFMHAIDASGQPANSCSAQYNTAGADYSLTSTSRSCRIFIYYQVP